MSIYEYRNKGKNALKTILNKEQNVIIIEKNIYKTTLLNLKKYEDLEKVYLFNIFQIVNELHLNKNIKLQQILKTIKDGNIYWKHAFFNNMIEKENEQDNFLVKPFEIEEGVLTCKCGSSRVFSYSKQCRGGDESSTTFATCVACKAQWTYSG